MNAQRMNLFDQGVAQTDTGPSCHRSTVSWLPRPRGSEGPSSARSAGESSRETAGLTTPVVVSPCEELVRGGRSRQPRSDLSIEPRLLLMRIVDGHERPEAVRAHVTGHDQEIAR